MRYRLLSFVVPHPRKILVVDHNADNGALLVRTLLRKFPAAAVQLCAETGTAVHLAASENIDAVVIHRTLEDSAAELTKTLRKLSPDAIIIVVSGVDRSQDVIAAGADGFLSYEAWLRIGTVVSEAMEARQSPPRRASANPFARREPSRV